MMSVNISDLILNEKLSGVTMIHSRAADGTSSINSVTNRTEIYKLGITRQQLGRNE